MQNISSSSRWRRDIFYMKYSYYKADYKRNIKINSKTIIHRTM